MSKIWTEQREYYQIHVYPKGRSHPDDIHGVYTSNSGRQQWRTLGAVKGVLKRLLDRKNSLQANGYQSYNTYELVKRVEKVEVEETVVPKDQLKKYAELF